MYTRRGLLQMLAASTAWPASEASDWRNITTGTIIPDESYSDQPYVVIANDGNWLCVLTTGKAVEGQGGTLRLYNRYLRTAEAVAHFRAGRA